MRLMCARQPKEQDQSSKEEEEEEELIVIDRDSEIDIYIDPIDIHQEM